MTTFDRPFGRYLEDFEIGDVYQHWPGKTITEYDDHLFCMITMNHHPVHTNAWFAESEEAACSSVGTTRSSRSARCTSTGRARR
jgi:acyl dehydratase